MRLRAGDSWKWTRSFDGYPVGDGWALQYVLNASGVARFAFPGGSAVANPDGQSFDVTVTAAQTANVQAATYDLYAILTNSTTSEQRTVELESVIVEPNIASGLADTRSFVKKTLDAIEAAIAGDTSPHIQEYEIHGRRVRYMDRDMLYRLRGQFKTEYRQEQIAAGEFVPKRTAHVSFGGGA